MGLKIPVSLVRFQFGAPNPDVTQFGRVLALGARCRRFDPCHSDHRADSFQFYQLSQKTENVL